MATFCGLMVFSLLKSAVRCMLEVLITLSKLKCVDSKPRNCVHVPGHIELAREVPIMVNKGLVCISLIQILLLGLVK